MESDGLIIVECKSKKDSGYNKFSSVSRQITAYIKIAQAHNYFVKKALLVAPEFSDDFVNDCGISDEIDLSIIEASTLKSINDKFRSVKQATFPYRLLTKDVLISEARILKALGK